MASHLEKLMFVFPGQGSQYRSMGSDLYAESAAAKAVFDEASDVLGFDMKTLCFEDPEDKLNLTAYTQPALLTHSIACLRVFEEASAGELSPAMVAGHSLGEYSALVAAKALSFADALRLVRTRGELMSEHGTGSMVAAAMELDVIQPYVERHYCGVGGCNLPNQTVVGGLDDDVERLVAAIKDDHPRARLTRLKTEGAFHTHLMTAAALEFRSHLEAAPMAAPQSDVISNYSGDLYDRDPTAIKYRLFFQLFHPVRWLQGCQRALETGVSYIVEFGGGMGKEDNPSSRRPNLAALIKRTVKAGIGRYGPREQDCRPIDGGKALYFSAIHLADIHKTAAVLGALGQRSAEEAASSHRIHIPTAGGIPLESAIATVERLATSNVDVSLVYDDEATNRANNQEHFGVDKAQAYLERRVDGGPPTFVVAADIADTLGLD